MKIGFILDDSLDKPDGVQQYVLALGGWLSSRGHDVHYLVGETTRSDIKNIHSLSRNIKVSFNGNRMSVPLWSSSHKIKKLLAAERFDILHVQMPYSPFMAGKIIKQAAARTPIVATFHILPESKLVSAANYLLAAVTRTSRRRIDKVYAVSVAAQQFVRNAYNASSTVMPNIIDVSRFVAGYPIQKYTKPPTILFLGRLVPRKGCQILLQAVNILKKTYPELQFQTVICGKGPLGDSLETYVRQNNLESHVTFTGFIQEIEKPDYLASAKIAVFPSSGGESFGIVLVEAMAAGRAVVLAGDNPGYRSVLADYNAQLFSAHNADALAKLLYTYLCNSRLAGQTIKAQNEYVKQFDTKAVGQKIEADYYDLLRTKRLA